MTAQTIVQKLRLVPGDPTAFNPADRQDKWVSDKKVYMEMHRLPGIEMVKHGKNAEQVMFRLHYWPRQVQLNVADRLLINGKQYNIMYVDTVFNVSTKSYCEIQEVE